MSQPDQPTTDVQEQDQQMTDVPEPPTTSLQRDPNSTQRPDQPEDPMHLFDENHWKHQPEQEQGIRVHLQPRKHSSIEL